METIGYVSSTLSSSTYACAVIRGIDEPMSDRPSTVIMMIETTVYP